MSALTYHSDWVDSEEIKQKRSQNKMKQSVLVKTNPSLPSSISHFRESPEFKRTRQTKLTEVNKGMDLHSTMYYSPRDDCVLTSPVPVASHCHNVLAEDLSPSSLMTSASSNSRIYDLLPLSSSAINEEDLVPFSCESSPKFYETGSKENDGLFGDEIPCTLTPHKLNPMVAEEDLSPFKLEKSPKFHEKLPSTASVLAQNEIGRNSPPFELVRASTVKVSLAEIFSNTPEILRT